MKTFARRETVMKETHELCKVPWIGHKKGQSCLPRQRSLFHFPYPPQVVPWKTTRVNKNQRAQTNPRAEKTGLSNLQPREGKTGITNLSKQITNFWRPPVTTYPTARQKAETADPKTSCRLSNGYRPKRSLLKALAPE